MTSMPLLLLACGESPARVELAPIDLGPACIKPTASEVTAIRVIAYTASGEVRRTESEIADFPADTEQVGIEILGRSSEGGILANGKSVPLAFGSLADGATIPIAVLPPNGFCPIHSMTMPRSHPLLARAGSGVLVVGGGPAAEAEYYDATTATFSAVALPSVLADDPSAIAGAAVATLPDGRVVVSGGQALTVFDPKTKAFSSPALISRRLQHTAIAVGQNRVLLVGGCLSPNAPCDAAATPLRSALEYEIDASGQIIGDGRARVSLPAASARYASSGFDVGMASDGIRRMVVAAGNPDPTTADRLLYDERADAGTAIAVHGTHAQPALLDGGAVLTAFDPDGAPKQTGAASIVPPEDGDATGVAIAPNFDGARLVTAEDGSVFAIGGDTDIARYVPTTNSWSRFTPLGQGPGARKAPSLIRLDDGSVLVVGATDHGIATDEAWLFRPSLVGPHVGQVVAFPDGTGAILTSPNPQAAQRIAGRLELTAASSDARDLSARVLVGGPRVATATMTAAVRVASQGGVALIAQQTAPARALVAVLVVGQPARVERRLGAESAVLCTGAAVTAEDLALPLQLVVHRDRVTASVGSSPIAKVSCDFSRDVIAAEPGMWGIAAVAEAVVDVVAVTVAR